MRFTNSYRKRGSSIAETAASMVLIIPLFVLILFVVLEASKAYLIKEALAQGAREAARNLAIAYGQNPSIQYSRTGQDSSVFDNIRINDVIAASTQFQDPTWDTNAQPPTVSVVVNYTSNQNGLPPFPNPDPLHLGSNFQLSATSTYRLE